MKRVLLLTSLMALMAVLPGIACAAQQNLNYTTKTDWKTEGPKVQNNFTELYTNKANALGADDNYVTDAEKVKLINLSGTNTGDQDISGKADKTSFASQSAFTTAWGWTPGGISAWSDVQSLISGTGDYIKYDGTRGTPSGSLPTGTDGQVIQYGSGGTPAAVDLAPLVFTGNVTRNATTGVVSVDLSGKENADSTIIKVAEIDSQSKFETLVGWTLPATDGGTGGYISLSAAPYSDVACTTGQYGYYGTTAYLCTGGFWTSKWTLTAHSNPTPGGSSVDYILASGGSNSVVVNSSNPRGQSFTVASGQAGVLEKITIDIGTVYTPGTISCRVGLTASQTDLSSGYASGTASISASATSYSFDISSGPTIAVGEVYSVACVGVDSVEAGVLAAINTGAYSGGMMYYSPGVDMDMTGHADTLSDMNLGITVRQ